jgi:hypothetical protein
MAKKNKPGYIRREAKRQARGRIECFIQLNEDGTLTIPVNDDSMRVIKANDEHYYYSKDIVNGEPIDTAKPLSRCPGHSRKRPFKPGRCPVCCRRG